MTKETENRVNMRLKPDEQLHTAIVAYQKFVLLRHKRKLNLDEAAYELIQIGVDSVPEVKQFIAA